MFLAGLVAAVCVILALYVQGLSYISVCALLFLFGVFSSTEMLNFPYAREISHKGFCATAIATTNMLTVLGAAFSQPLVGSLLDRNWSGAMQNGVRVYSEQAYMYAFIVIPVLLLMGGFLALLLKKTDYELTGTLNAQTVLG